MLLTGPIYYNDCITVSMVWNLCPLDIYWLLFWLQKTGTLLKIVYRMRVDFCISFTAVRTSGENQSDTTANPRSGLVSVTVYQVKHCILIFWACLHCFIVQHFDSWYSAIWCCLCGVILHTHRKSYMCVCLLFNTL